MPQKRKNTSAIDYLLLSKDAHYELIDPSSIEIRRKQSEMINDENFSIDEEYDLKRV